MGTHPATSCSRCPKRFWKAPLKFHQPRWLLRVDFSRLPLANLLHRPVESTVVSHPAPPQKSPIAIARALRATGGKTGGIFGIFLPESIALEPSQNVFWGSGQSLTEASVTALECLFQRVSKAHFDPLPSVEFCWIPALLGANMGARLPLKKWRAPKYERLSQLR